jgi:RNA polymerase sigma factor (sigma-70 family)
MTGASDVELVNAVRGGNLAAYASLYAMHVGAVQTVVRAQVHDPGVAEDVVQDVFVRALESLPKLDDAERFRAWLLAIARHTAIDARRKLVRQRTVSSSDSDDGTGIEADLVGGVEPDRLTELSELSELVWGAVAGLSKRDATAMALVSLGFGIADVAVALNVSHGAAKVAVHRARERARQALLLEVMVRRQGPHCPKLDPTADLVETARHLRTCPDCREAVRRDL